MTRFMGVTFGVTTVFVACPRECGNDDVEVVWHEYADEFTPELSCSCCNSDVLDGSVVRPPLLDGREYMTPTWNFTDAERAILVQRAKDAVDNYDGGDP